MRLSGGLGDLFRELSRRAGVPPVVEEIRSHPWASATFVGARHHIGLRFEGPDAGRNAAAAIAGLGHAEFDLSRHLLVDIAVVERQSSEDRERLVIEALVVEQD